MQPHKGYLESQMALVLSILNDCCLSAGNFQEGFFEHNNFLYNAYVHIMNIMGAHYMQ
jgi:hypothetical protein